MCLHHGRTTTYFLDKLQIAADLLETRLVCNAPESLHLRVDTRHDLHAVQLPNFVSGQRLNPMLKTYEINLHRGPASSQAPEDNRQVPYTLMLASTASTHNPIPSIIF